MLQWARQRNHVLPFTVAAGGTWIALTIAPQLHWSMAVVVLFATIFLVYLELLTQWSFRAPTKRKPALELTGWKRLDITVEGYRLAHYLKAGEPNKPVAWLCHGWTSGAIRMVDRAKPFVDRGWNVVLWDLPSHGASDRLSKWSAEQTTTLMIQSMNWLAKDRPAWFANGVCYYGHSIGGFIGLRTSRRRSELTSDVNILGWVFESPMTGYTEIHAETCNLLRIPHRLRPWVLAKTLRHFNAINDAVGGVSSLSDADMPEWGVPRESTLLVQASPDNRLGERHHERLTQIMEKPEHAGLLTAHYLSDLSHSGSHMSPSRDAVLSAWLDECLIHSSSV